MPVTGKTGVHSSSRGMCLRRDHHDHEYCCYHDYPDHHYDDDDGDVDLDERETCKTLGHCDTT